MKSLEQTGYTVSLILKHFLIFYSRGQYGHLNFFFQNILNIKSVLTFLTIYILNVLNKGHHYAMIYVCESDAIMNRSRIFQFSYTDIILYEKHVLRWITINNVSHILV